MATDFLGLLTEYLSVSKDISHHKNVALNSLVVGSHSLPADEMEVNDLYLSLARAKLKVILRKITSNTSAIRFLADIEEMKKSLVA